MQQYSEPTNIRALQTAQQMQEPILTYDEQKGRWSGTNTLFSFWMDDANFRAYVASWYNWSTWFPHLPPEERQTIALAHCQCVSYWNGCEHNYDRRVHISYH